MKTCFYLKYSLMKFQNVTCLWNFETEKIRKP